MSERADIALGGAAYPILPGGYKRESVGRVPSALHRVEVTALETGLLRAAGSAGGWSGLAVGPGAQRLGVEPWPQSVSASDATIAAATPKPGYGVLPRAVIGDAAYFALGKNLYKFGAGSDASWSAATFVKDCTETISAVIAWKGMAIVGRGPFYDGYWYLPGTGALSTWRAGERVAHGVTSQGALHYTNDLPHYSTIPSQQEQLRIGVTRYDGTVWTDTRRVDSRIRQLLIHNGRVAILTNSSVQLLGGQEYQGTAANPVAYWVGDPQGGTTYGSNATAEDLTFAESFRGKLYTWLGGRIASWDGAQANAGWVYEGPEGTVCYGSCVAGGRLIVSLANRSGIVEVWATGGDGDWWRIGADSGAARLWPTNVAGCGGVDFVCFVPESGTLERYRIVARGSSRTAWSAAASWVSPLLDLGDRMTPKAWRRVEAEFANPDGRAWGYGALSVSLDYSIDAGKNWTQAATLTTAAAADRVWRLAADLPSGVLATTLQLRVRWADVTNWTPVLCGAAAEGLPMPAPGRRRRWQLHITCSDRAVNRAGGRLERTGKQLAADLWAAYDAGAVVQLIDVDDRDGDDPRDVRIIRLVEKAGKASDQWRWGETVLEVDVLEI
ncbi:MAG: hypothetical protein IT337_03125 [Thermomicrobiales bacterium]|nr:hypothetical protein [Thermomicrobiales bacterium]